MTVLTLGEAAALAIAGATSATAARKTASRLATVRSDTPVRRDSVEAGTFEEGFFVAPARGETDQLLRKARAALDSGRRLKRLVRTEQRVLTAAEQAVAALTASAIRVYEELLTLARLNRGRVYPSYNYLADVTALARATVARALQALESAGFLVRQRRFKRIAGRGPGPRLAQTSNAYRPTLPQRVVTLFPRRFHPAPPPDDALTREAERQADTARMLDSLSCAELGQATANGALGRILAELGAAIDRRMPSDARESQFHPETSSQLYTKAHEAVPTAGLGMRTRAA